MENLYKVVDEVYRKLESTGKHFAMYVESDDGVIYTNGNWNYKLALAVIAVTAEDTMNQMIPDYGDSVKHDLKAVLNDTIRLNEAKPKPETEKAINNMKAFLAGERK